MVQVLETVREQPMSTTATEEGFEAMEDQARQSKQEVFKRVMLIAGISRPTITMMIQRNFFNDLEKFNRRENKTLLTKSVFTFRITEEEVKLLNLFRDYYTSLTAHERLSLARDFDSAAWQDFKDRRHDNTRRTWLIGSGVLLICLVVLAFLSTAIHLQRRSLEASLARLDIECTGRVPVDCRLIQCSCCYQREKTSNGDWIASSTKC